MSDTFTLPHAMLHLNAGRNLIPNRVTISNKVIAYFDSMVGVIPAYKDR